MYDPRMPVIVKGTSATYAAPSNVSTVRRDGMSDLMHSGGTGQCMKRSLRHSIFTPIAGPALPGCTSRLLSALGLDLHHLDVEFEDRIRRYRSVHNRTVAEGRRNRQLALAAHLHSDQAIFPPLDDPPGAENERQRLLSYRAVELGSVRERPGVVNRDLVARLRRGAGTRP